MCSVVELSDHSDSALGPPTGLVLLHHVQLHGDDVVCGVAGGGKRTAAGKCLVDRARISVACRNVCHLRRFQPDARHLREEDLGV